MKNDESMRLKTVCLMINRTRNFTWCFFLFSALEIFNCSSTQSCKMVSSTVCSYECVCVCGVGLGVRVMVGVKFENILNYSYE